jgi:hypothetical protein
MKTRNLRSTLTTVNAKFKSIFKSRLFMPLLAFVVLVGFITPAESARQSEKAYKQELKSAVDKPNGAPRDGRDPASQGQNSLASAASKENGAGLRTDKPAANVKGDNGKHVHPHDVLADPKTDGTTSGGCIIGYGQAGAQCLPTNGDHKKITCDYVRKYFPNGVAVTGDDSLKLDKNGDKTACGNGDNGDNGDK